MVLKWKKKQQPVEEFHLVSGWQLPGRGGAVSTSVCAQRNPLHLGY